MPKPELPAHVRRDQPVTAMVTRAEKKAVQRVMAQLGMSQSNAARYLINLGLAHFPFTSTEGTAQP
jgi:hypothetical protein